MFCCGFYTYRTLKETKANRYTNNSCETGNLTTLTSDKQTIGNQTKTKMKQSETTLVTKYSIENVGIQHPSPHAGSKVLPIQYQNITILRIELHVYSLFVDCVNEFQ